MRDDTLYLKDIISAIDAIEVFTRGMEFESFRKDDLICSAVVRKLEVIGEAAKNVPESIKEKAADIPWREMAGMRDKLIHFYFGIKYDLVWNTIKDVLPGVRPLLDKALKGI